MNEYTSAHAERQKKLLEKEGLTIIKKRQEILRKILQGETNMRRLLNLPHAKYESTCYINGFYDILTWKGGKYEYFLLPIIGGMAGFAYLKFKMAKPPFMVYWGNSPKYLLKELSEIIGYEQEIIEGRSWKTTSQKIKESIDKGEPVLAGALDMYYLHYYPDLYNKIHVPIHYVLVVGYDDEKEEFYLHDCSYDQVQEVTYTYLMKSLDVRVPGMSKKNTLRIFKLPGKLPSEVEIVEKGLEHKAERMLKPPISMIGIPAMRKLAKEISSWNSKECFKHMAAYAGMSPPLIPEDLRECNGLRFEQAKLLEKLGNKYNKKEWVETGGLFDKSGGLIIELCKNAVKYDGKKCNEILKKIADVEEEAYQIIKRSI